MHRSAHLRLGVLLLGLVGCGGGTTGRDAGQPVADVGAVVDVGIDAASIADAGTDGGSTGACTNATDMPITQMASTPSAVTSCGQSTLGREPDLLDCITSMTTLSSGCATCYDDEVQCVIANCLGSGCASAPMGVACNNCRIAMCHPAFATCSGLP